MSILNLLIASAVQKSRTANISHAVFPLDFGGSLSHELGFFLTCFQHHRQGLLDAGPFRVTKDAKLLARSHVGEQGHGG